jgi:subtilisin family serine protease
MHSRRGLFAWLVLAAGFALIGAVSPAVVGQAADSTVALQGPDNATVDSEIQADGGAVEVLVSLEGDGAGVVPRDQRRGETTVSQLQARANASQSALQQFAAETPGVRIETRLWLVNAALVRVDTARVPVDRLTQVEGVESVTRNSRIEAAESADQVPPSGADAGAGSGASVATGTEPGADTATAGTAGKPKTTYGPAQMNATEVWSAYDRRGEGASVAVLDTGVDPDHPDINLTGWAEFDSEGNQRDTEPQDYGSHGTRVTGLVAGGAASGEYLGAAPEADLYHGAVLTNCNPGCSGSTAQIIGGIQWAVANDIDVVSLSFGNRWNINKGYIDAVRNAEAAGTTVVAAIGNDGKGIGFSPGTIYESIGVGASTPDGRVWPDSGGKSVFRYTAPITGKPPVDWPNSYLTPTLVGPGVNVTTTTPGGGYQQVSGTSYATPQVAGAIALVESAVDRPVSPTELRGALEATARKPESAPAPPGERDIRYGAGIVDALGAVSELRTTLTAAFTVEPTVPAVGEPTTFRVLNPETATPPYRWDFDGDGTVDATTTDPVVTHTYPGPGERTATLTVENATGATRQERRTLTVRRPAASRLSNLDIALEGTNATVLEGTPKTVSVTVTNTGGKNASFDVALTVGPITRTRSTRVLGPGESQRVAFNALRAVDNGTYTVALSTDGSGVNGTVTVEPAPPAAIQALDIADGTETVVRGDSINISVTVRNEGDRVALVPVTLMVDSMTVLRRAVPLAAGSSGTVTFENITVSVPPGSYRVTATTDTDTANGTLTVEQPATMLLSDLEIADRGPNATVPRGASAFTSVNVTNVGAVSGSAQVKVQPRTNGTVRFTERDSTEIAPGETERVTFNSNMLFETGRHAMVVTTPSDRVTGTLTKTPKQATPKPVNLSVGGESVSWSEAVQIRSNDSEDVTVTVVNTGDRSGSFSVSLRIGTGLIAAGSKVRHPVVTRTQTTETLAPPENPTREFSRGENTTLVFEDATAPLGAGEYGIVVQTEGGTTDMSLRVEQGPLRLNPPVPNADKPVRFNATGFTGQVTEYRWDFDGDGSRDRTTTTSVTNYTYTEAGQRSPAVTAVKIGTANEQISMNMTVEPTPTLEFRDQNLSPSHTVVVENVSTDGIRSTLLVIQAGDSEDVVAGVTTGTFAGESVTVPLGKPDRIPGRHIVDLLPAADASGPYQPGDTVSLATSANIVDGTSGLILRGPMPPPVVSTFPEDIDGDGDYENIRSTDAFNILDVQALFNNLDTPAVQNNAGAYDFSGTDPTEVTVLDVQALFNELPG